MDLKTQIFSLIISFVYGIFFACLYNLFYSLINKTKIMYRVLVNVLFITNIALIYFIILLKVNNGNLHPIFVLILTLSFLIFIKKTKKLRKFVKVRRHVKHKINN